jgi:hypothetical protein
MSYVVIYKIAQGPFEIMVVTKKKLSPSFCFCHVCIHWLIFSTYAINPKWKTWIGHYLEGHLMACLPHVKIMVSRLSTILNHKFVELVATLGHWHWYHNIYCIIWFVARLVVINTTILELGACKILI